MGVIVQWQSSGALLRRCAEIQANARPGSRVQNAMRKDLRRIVVDDHVDKMLRGVDRYGRPRAPLASSTTANPKRGPGPSLIPRGMASRFIRNFEATWVDDVLVMRFVNIVDRKGRPFSQYHLTGTRKMPRRDVGGITPKGWAQVRERFQLFATQVVRGH